jgi:PAS domain S-box-containing protein
MIASKHSINKKSVKFRLRTYLVVPFVLQVVGAVSLVGWLSWRNGQQAVNDVAYQLRSETTNRIHERLLFYTELPHQANQLSLNALAGLSKDIPTSQLNPQNSSEIGRLFLRQMKLYPDLGFIGFATPKGELWGGERRVDGTLLINRQDASTNDQLQMYSVDDEGNAIQKVESYKDYDARVRPWYKRAVEAGKPAWTNVFITWVVKTPAIDAVMPVYDQRGQLQGVMDTTFYFTHINKFLQKLKIGKTGSAFIIEHSGGLVATSTNAALQKRDEKNVQRMNATESENGLIRATAVHLQKRFGEFSQIKENQQLSFNFNGENQFVQITPLKDSRGLNWLTVVVVPESDFMSQIHANSQRTILLCLAALVIAIAVGIFTTNLITRPIRRVTQASKDIANGNLDQHVQVRGIIEIETLADSFNSMAIQLKDSFETLEAKNEALRMAEENYRSIFENALEGIFQATSDGHFISVNPAMSNILGYDSPQQMIASVTEISTQLYVDPNTRQEFNRVMEEQGAVKNFEYQAYRQDGSVTWIQEDTRAVRDTAGKLLYFEGIIQDINKRKQNEELIKQQLQELKIEIDQQKRQYEVAKITQSDYFQEIQAEAENLQFDEFWN